MLNAFCRVAPSVRLNLLAILPAGVFLRAIVFSSRTSPDDQARRFFALLAIKPPSQLKATCRRYASRTNGRQRRRRSVLLKSNDPRQVGTQRQWDARTNGFVRLFLARCGPGINPSFAAIRAARSRPCESRKIRRTDRIERIGEDFD